jgi:hypothetical protein
VVRQKPTEADNPAIKDDSIVQAFEKAQDKTRAYFTVEDKAKSRGTGSKLEFFSYRDENVIAAFKNEGLRVTSIVAYSLPAERREFPPLRTSFGSGGKIFEVVSNAQFTGKTFLITTVITTSSAETKVYAPALLATDRATFVGPLDEKSVFGFLAALQKQSDVPLELVDRKYESKLSFSPSTTVGTPPLFVSVHPLTVLAPSGSYCIGVYSYLPVPIDVGGQYCNQRVMKK